MKIWVIGRGYPLPKNLLQGSFELEQAKMLARHGHDVTYMALVFHPFRKVHKWGFDSWQEEGVEVKIRCAVSLPGRFRVQWASYRRRMWRRFFEEVRAENGLPDVIHVHYPTLICNTFVLEEYKKKGVKIVCTEHWTKVLTENVKPHELDRLKWHMSNADAVAAVGTPLAEAMRKLAASLRTVEIVPNVVNPVFTPAEEKKASPFRFIAVGRLVGVKQFDKTICAFDDAFHGREDVSLTIVGKGEEYRKLKELIEKRGAGNNVFLPGVMTRRECAEAVANSHCLVCYSRLETFGVPVIEAWACGVPVIGSSHLGFMRDSVGSKLGIVADVSDTESLKAALLHMYQTIDKYDSGFISRHAKEYYSEEAVCRRLAELYRGI